MTAAISNLPRAPHYLPLALVDRAGILGHQAKALSNVIGYSADVAGDRIDEDDILILCDLLTGIINELEAIAETEQPAAGQAPEAPAGVTP